MSRSSFRGHWRRAARIMLAVVGAMLGLQAPRAMPPAHAAVPAAHQARSAKLCAWGSRAIGSRRIGNAGYIDTRGLYLMMRFGLIPGLTMRIHGLYPYARFMSITVYAARSRVLIDHLADQSIVPDRGSTNPFYPMANRQAFRRSYTVYIQQGLAPSGGRARNTIYTGPYHPVLVMYRIYAPDLGADDYGNVPEPQVDILVGKPHRYKRAIPLPECSSPRPVRPALVPVMAPLLQWQRFGALSRGAVNPDEAYLSIRLDRDYADVYVTRFKAPTFAHTYDGGPISGREDVRFWSVCMYGMVTTRVIACLHDYQAVQSRAGYVTIVISTLANRPSTATGTNGINWLPFGREQVGMLLYRQLLPSPTFQGSFLNVAPDALPSEMQRALGRYLPTIEPCSSAGYTPTGCSDQSNPLACSDLTEPVPCTPSQGTMAPLTPRPMGTGPQSRRLVQPTSPSRGEGEHADSPLPHTGRGIGG